MNIQPVQNNISMQANPNSYWHRLKRRVSQHVLDTLPEHTKKESARKLEGWDKFDNWISKPAQNRFVMGATALMTQPFIDYSNKKVDKETRTIAFFNRCAVILAGTTVGICLARGPVYKAIEKMTDINGKSKLSKFLLPKKYLEEIAGNEKFLKNYRSALSMSVALGVMLFTNILDAYLAMNLTNFFKDHFCKKKEVEEVKNG